MAKEKIKVKKLRADEILLARELAETREEAAKLIMAGLVRYGADSLIHNASEIFPEDIEIIVEKPCPYVSRGAYKLMPALDKYLPDLSGKTAADLGASTGGFSDLMLQRGAVKIFAIDSGRGQLHAKLRNDRRVVSMEQFNARNMQLADTDGKEVDVITADLSFISLEKILPAADRILKKGGMVFALVKPQFEAERHLVGQGGVVRDHAVRLACVEKIKKFAVETLQWEFIDSIESPLPGPKGNIEFVAVFRKT